ncbi:sensor histidine kinase [Blautia sp. AF19-1]|uniref:sensor histidine kinase n=1 Tax=Blautia sp. AF19-1 TaxID=2292960 RepID=UPI001314DCE3|nr:ATP-binding protein [Blautia sp. AF19-1]
MEEKKQHLEANIPTRLYCEVEQSQIERAIQNILVNAIRYSPSGELIRISLSETHGTIRGEIENTGVRVPDDAIPHLFEAFYRADTSRNRNTGGTGLGLYIVRKVMEMHRANYGISNINNGVLFWFELPCKQPVDNSI